MELAADIAKRPVRRALPREAMWFFVVAPPILAFLFNPDCAKSVSGVTGALVAVTLYTVVTGVAVHFSFEALAARLRSVPVLLRIPIHALAAALVVVAATAALLPIIDLLHPPAAGRELSILWRGIIVSFGYLAGASFVGHLQRQAVRERLRAHAERTAALEARLNSLQAQTQPHFLFNSLNAIASLVHSDPDLAEETLERLAALLRYALDSSQRRLVRLDEELSAVRDYLEIQQLRFGDRLRYRLEIADATRDCALPPMLIQPLVENAVIHGLRGREHGGEVVVEAKSVDGKIEVHVRDDGVGPGASTHRGNGTGLRNVRERLRLVFGGDAQLITAGANHGGFVNVLTLPPTEAR